MSVEKISAFGWDNCARLANEHAELIVSLEVGPRILSYKLPNGENVLRTYPDQLGKSGEPNFQVRGGHRIWVSPENDRTYAPDNGSVKFAFKEPSVLEVETPPSDPWRVRKSMAISLAAESSAVLLQHRVTNEGREPIGVASWGLTILIPGGLEVIPQPPLGTHGKEFLPNRVIVPWTYTDFSDDRWKFGRQFFTLRPTPGRPATKLGLSHRERWVGYIAPPLFYVKTFDYEDGAPYPDLGCNFETFSKDDFIEIETLSPLRQLAPGESVGHTETWHLFGGLAEPDALDEAALERWLAPFLPKIGIL